MSLESINNTITGEYQDTIYYSDGRVEVKEVQRNCIVNGITTVLASLLKGERASIGYWAVGSGSEIWDSSTPTEALPTDTKCVNEIGRKSISSSSIEFIGSNGNPTSSPTNKIRVKTIFQENECNGKWREFAIFAGKDVSITLNSGIAINHKTHGLIVKDATMTVERQIIFTFN